MKLRLMIDNARETYKCDCVSTLSCAGPPKQIVVEIDLATRHNMPSLMCNRAV